MYLVSLYMEVVENFKYIISHILLQPKPDQSGPDQPRITYFQMPLSARVVVRYALLTIKNSVYVLQLNTHYHFGSTHYHLPLYT